jgi:NTP pyrophosphatase (non-canonical NTP hydrolase)
MDTFSTYQQLAITTLASPSAEHSNLQHAGMGLITEVGEIVDSFKRSWFYHKDLDLANIKEEIGDVLWYIAVGYHSLSLVMPEEINNKYLSSPKSVTMCLGRLSHVVSNFYFFSELSIEANSELIDEDIYELNYDLDSILYYLSHLCTFLDLSLLDCAHDNIVKLAKRYPEGFTEFHANNRDKENELSHINGTSAETPVETVKVTTKRNRSKKRKEDNVS